MYIVYLQEAKSVFVPDISRWISREIREETLETGFLRFVTDERRLPVFGMQKHALCLKSIQAQGISPKASSNFGSFQTASLRRVAFQPRQMAATSRTVWATTKGGSLPFGARLLSVSTLRKA